MNIYRLSPKQKFKQIVLGKGEGREGEKGDHYTLNKTAKRAFEMGRFVGAKRVKLSFLFIAPPIPV